MVSTYTSNNALVIKIEQQRCDVSIASKMQEVLLKLTGDNHRYMVVDFSVVKYVDSSFLGALVSFLKRASANSSEVVVASLSNDVLTLFKLIRLDQVFKIYGLVKEAVDNAPQ
jgi:anti-sigma B factor antagonist